MIALRLPRGNQPPKHDSKRIHPSDALIAAAALHCNLPCASIAIIERSSLMHGMATALFPFALRCMSRLAIAMSWIPVC
jgi:hypothetical protein